MYSLMEHYEEFEKPIHQTLPVTYVFDSIPYSMRGYTGRNLKRIAPYHQPCQQRVYGKETYMIVKIPRVTTDSEYHFTSDCCYLDMKTYFENEQILDAVAINGVFFNFKEDFGPVGYYKQHDLISTTHSIPPGFDPTTSLYEPYFRALTIKNGQLAIDPRSIHEVWQERDQFSHIMVTGPIVIDQGVIVMTEELVQKKHQGIPIFQCDKPTLAEKDHVLLTRNHQTILSCDGADPGGLFHLANTNPRSAIAMSMDGTIYFICVMGRCNNYMGMDAVRLTQCIKEKIPDVWMAVLVDGGASSKCIQKHNGHVYVTQHQTNTMRYHVGNIISYQKVLPTFVQHRLLQKGLRPT